MLGHLFEWFLSPILDFIAIAAVMVLTVQSIRNQIEKNVFNMF